MKPILLIVVVLSAALLLLSLSHLVSGNTKKVFPSGKRIQIPSEFAKNYWVSGTFFNQANFKGLPTSFYFPTSKCVNFFNSNQTKSLKPSDCVMLYKAKDCQGPYKVFTGETQDVGGEEVGSMKSCPKVDDSWRQLGQEQEQKPANAEKKIIKDPVVEIEEEEKPEYKTIDLGKKKL